MSDEAEAARTQEESEEDRRERMRELGRRGGQVTAAKRAAEAELKGRVRADLRARRLFEDAADEMARVIIRAAMGEGDFKVLDPKERAQFALKALEYGVGRPRPVDPQTEERQEQGGLSFEVVEPKDATTQTEVEPPRDGPPGQSEA